MEQPNNPKILRDMAHEYRRQAGKAFADDQDERALQLRQLADSLAATATAAENLMESKRHPLVTLRAG